MSSRTGSAALLLAGALAMVVAGYTMIMTTFMVYDDEGFVLMSLRQFLSGQLLYNEVFTQYGPAPYFYHWILTLGGSIELTHFFGRLLTLIHWLICAGAGGWMASRLVTDNRALVGAAAGLLTFNALWQMIAEPTHPGSFIAATIAIGSALGVVALERARPLLMAGVIGLVGAILCLTKINVGLFFVAGAGAFALIHTDLPESWRRSARILAGMGMTLSPWLLMAGNLDDSRMLWFAAKASAAGFGLWWIVTAVSTSSVMSIRQWGIALLAFAGGLGVIVAFIVFRGTSIGELVSAVAIEPLRQPGNFTVPPRSSFHSLIFSALTTGAVIWAGLDIRNRGELSRRCWGVIVVARSASVIGLMIFALRWPSPWGAFTLLDYALPLLPLWLIPRNRDAGSRFSIETWLAFIAVFQALHAYPVAGSQIGWGCYLIIPLFVAGAARSLQATESTQFRYQNTVAAATLAVAGLLGTLSMVQTGWARYQSSRPLPFAGTTDLRLDDRTRAALTSLVQNISVHGDLLFSRQGMYSFNIWSETPTPTSRNATHWFWLLDQSEQQAVIDALQDEPRAVFVVNEPLDTLLNDLNVPVEGPLQAFVQSSFVEAFRLGGYSFRTYPDRDMAHLGLAEVFVSTESGQSAVKLRATSLLAEPPAAVELVAINHDGSFGEILSSQAEGHLTAIRRDGILMSERLKWEDWPNRQGLYQIDIFSESSPDPRAYKRNALIIKNATGEVIAEALFD